MSNGGPMRQKDTLADVVEMLLDKGIVINADIIVTIGETELLGIHLRAAIASFETAAEYGLEFPDGTDTDRIDEITGRKRHLETIRATGGEVDVIDENEETATWTVRPPVAVPVGADAETQPASEEATASDDEAAEPAAGDEGVESSDGDEDVESDDGDEATGTDADEVESESDDETTSADAEDEEAEATESEADDDTTDGGAADDEAEKDTKAEDNDGEH